MRTFAGISWVFFSFALFILVKAVIFTPLSNESITEFTPYVTIGFFVWVYMQTSISEGCNSFIAAAGWIKGSRVPLSIFIYQNMARNIILTFVNFLVVVIVMLLTRIELGKMAVFIIPVIILFLINSFWVTLFFAIVSTRYRDIVHGVQTIMRVMLFLTPIFWKPEQMGALWKILIFNPFSHFVILAREPILENTFPWLSFYVVVGITITGLAAALFAYTKNRTKIVFWL
jgi:lipopolysaccharide transport system permease protein